VPIPLAPYTTFAQFRDHLIYIGCKYGPLPVASREPMVYFENPIPGRAIPPDAIMKLLPDGAEVLAWEIRSICDQLEVDPKEFGFNYPP
jgi:hypothetical protein